MAEFEKWNVWRDQCSEEPLGIFNGEFDVIEFPAAVEEHNACIDEVERLKSALETMSAQPRTLAKEDEYMNRILRSHARDEIIDAMVAAALREQECGNDRLAEAIRAEASKLAMKWGYLGVSGLPLTWIMPSQ